MYRLAFDNDLLYSFIHSKEPFVKKKFTHSVYTIYENDDSSDEETIIVESSQKDLIELAYHIHQWSGGFCSFNEDDVIDCMEKAAENSNDS